MDKFEEIRRDLDEGLTRLRKYVEDDLAPETEKRTAIFLREVSEKLTEAAGWLDARRASNQPPQPQEPAKDPAPESAPGSTKEAAKDTAA
jgi:hypothetical protein